MGLSGQPTAGENRFCLAKLLLSFSKPKRCPLAVKGAPEGAPWAARAGEEAAEQRARGCCTMGPALKSSVFSEFAAAQATALTLQPPKQRPSKSLSLWASLRLAQGLRQHLGSPGPGREDGFGGLLPMGEKAGRR